MAWGMHAPGGFGEFSSGGDYDGWDTTLKDYYENNRGIAPLKKVITGLALSKDAIGGAHLWREKKLTQPDIFLSDTLKARAMDAGLRLPKHFRMKEV